MILNDVEMTLPRIKLVSRLFEKTTNQIKNVLIHFLYKMDQKNPSKDDFQDLENQERGNL